MSDYISGNYLGQGGERRLPEERHLKPERMGQKLTVGKKKSFRGGGETDGAIAEKVWVCSRQCLGVSHQD